MFFKSRDSPLNVAGLITFTILWPLAMLTGAERCWSPTKGANATLCTSPPYPSFSFPSLFAHLPCSIVVKEGADRRAKESENWRSCSSHLKLEVSKGKHMSSGCYNIKHLPEIPKNNSLVHDQSIEVKTLLCRGNTMAIPLRDHFSMGCQLSHRNQGLNS